MPANYQHHAFLEILTESEALAGGVTLVDKFTHHVYRAVRARSTSGAISREEFFTADTLVRELPGQTRTDRLQILTRLVKDGLIAQALLLSNAPGDRTLVPTPCFLARPDNQPTIAPLFEQILQRCEQAAIRRVESLAEVTAEEWQADLDRDLCASTAPNPAHMLGLGGSLFGMIGPAAFHIPPHPELIPATLARARRALISRGLCFEVRHFGLIPTATLPLPRRFFVASRFLRQQALPTFRREGVLRRDLETIALEEALHNGRDGRATTAFDVRRAGALQRMFARINPERDWFPGTLAVGTVLALADAMEQEFAAKREAQQQEATEAIIVRVLGDEAHAGNILCLDMAEWAALSDSTRKSLRLDERLLYCTFELESGTRHVLLPADPHKLAATARAAFSVSEQSAYKHWALEHALDLFATRLAALRTSDFRRWMDRILMNGSSRYLPWTVRLLGPAKHFMSGLLLPIARRKMLTEQQKLRERNLIRQRAFEQEQKNTSEQKGRTACIEALAELIDQRLDDCYLRERRIPSLVELTGSFANIDTRLVHESIQRNGYRLVPAGPDGEEQIVLYRKDDDWGIRALQLADKLADYDEAAEQLPEPQRERFEGRIRALAAVLMVPRTIRSVHTRKNRPSTEPEEKAPGLKRLSYADNELAGVGGLSDRVSALPRAQPTVRAGSIRKTVLRAEPHRTEIPAPELLSEDYVVGPHGS